MTTFKTTTLWIGGTSGFARSYFQAFDVTVEEDPHWLVLGVEEKRPPWLPRSVAFLSCDLTKFSKEITKCMEIDQVTTVIISIRPPLVTYRTNQQAWKYAQAMLHGLTLLLQALPQVQQIIHISSIAAIDHHLHQHLVSERDTVAVSSQQLVNSYDRFKKATEERVTTQWATCPPKSFTNLRFGAIFTDDPGCIQCKALSLQARLGPILAVPIDCNSGRNAATLLYLILREKQKSLQPVYFYCRPLHFTRPVSYGTYLQFYRQAFGIRYYLTVPDSWVRGFVWCFHIIILASSFLGRWIPFLESVDYLLRVTLEEHSFDQRLVEKDFPELRLREETILECFQRRRKQFL